MKRYGLLLATLLMLPLTGITLAQAGWFRSRAEIPAPARPVAEPRSRSHDSVASDAAWRWRECQPIHWHECVIQPR